MKREQVAPDLLAAMTADALFAPKPNVPAAQPAGHKPGSIFSLGRWFKTAPGGIAAAVGPQTSRLTLDDDWVGGWYARTRLLQAATLAKLAARDSTASTQVAGGETRTCADVVSQVKDFS
jgi:hypothetical protein